ncbi:hypothetical protein HK405_010051 [Cladochytrium tenue]|nr:hypothetical protein HK405_010051 [Cladochytrium tenue]
MDLLKNTKNNGKKNGSSKSDGNESRQNDERPDDSNKEETEKLSSSKKPGKPRKKVPGNEVDEGSDEQNQPNVENLRSKKASKKKGGKGGKKPKSKKSTLAKKNMDDENSSKSNADDGKNSNDGGEKVENFPGDSRTQKKAEKKSGKGGSSELGDDASGDGDKETGENRADSDERIESKGGPKRSQKKGHSKQKSTNGAKKHAKKSNDDGVSTDGEQSDPPSSSLNEDEVDEGTESKDVGGSKQSPNRSYSGQKLTKTGAKKHSKKNNDGDISPDGDQSKSPSNLKPKGSQPQKAGFRYVDLYARGLRKTGGRRYSAAHDNVNDDGNLYSGDNFDSYGDRNELQGDDLDADDALIADHILSGSKLSAIDDEMYDESDFGDENELDSIDNIEDDDYLISSHIITENGAEALEDSAYAEDNVRSWSKSTFREVDFVDVLASEEELDDHDAAFEDDFEDEGLGEDRFDDDDADVDDALDDDDLDDDETIDELDDEYTSDYFESDGAFDETESVNDESDLSGSGQDGFAPDSFEVDAVSTSSSSADLIDGATSSVYGEIPDPQVKKLTPFKIVAGIYFIASGVLLLVFGYRLFKPVLFVSGLNFTALVVLAIVSAIAARTGNYYSDSVYFFSAFVSGLLGGVVFICFWRAGVFTVGALLGYAVSTVILSLVSNGTIPSAVGGCAFIIAMAVAFGIAILFFERHLLIPATAVPGALSVTLGIDMYTQFGLVAAQRSFLSGSGGFSTSGRYWGLLAAFFVLAAIGCAMQAVLANRSRSKGANATAPAAAGAFGLAEEERTGDGGHTWLTEDIEKFQIGDESAALLGGNPRTRKM